MIPVLTAREYLSLLEDGRRDECLGGTPAPALLEDDGPRGRAYRDGIREIRRERADKNQSPEGGPPEPGSLLKSPNLEKSPEPAAAPAEKPETHAPVAGPEQLSLF